MLLPSLLRHQARSGPWSVVVIVVVVVVVVVNCVQKKKLSHFLLYFRENVYVSTKFKGNV